MARRGPRRWSFWRSLGTRHSGVTRPAECQRFLWIKHTCSEATLNSEWFIISSHFNSDSILYKHPIVQWVKDQSTATPALDNLSLLVNVRYAVFDSNSCPFLRPPCKWGSTSTIQHISVTSQIYPNLIYSNLMMKLWPGAELSCYTCPRGGVDCQNGSNLFTVQLYPLHVVLLLTCPDYCVQGGLWDSMFLLCWLLPQGHFPARWEGGTEAALAEVLGQTKT